MPESNKKQSSINSIDWVCKYIHGNNCFSLWALQHQKLIKDLHAQNNALEQYTNMVLQNHMIPVNQMVWQKEDPLLLTDQKYSYMVSMKMLDKTNSFKVFSHQNILIIY